MNLPFTGLKVIELATVLAGPSVGMFLAELVPKVEGRGVPRKTCANNHNFCHNLLFLQK